MDTQVILLFPAFVHLPVFMAFFCSLILEKSAKDAFPPWRSRQSHWLFGVGRGDQLRRQVWELSAGAVAVWGWVRTAWRYSQHHHEQPSLGNLFSYTRSRVANGQQTPLENRIQIGSVVLKDESESQADWSLVPVPPLISCEALVKLPNFSRPCFSSGKWLF